MDYSVKFVADTDLPPERDWALFQDGSRKILVIKEDRVCPEVLADIWRGFHEINGTN